MPGHSEDNVAELETPLVALGGSAGSVDALIRFFEVIPEDCGIAFVVVVHLSPSHESLLPELLQGCCALKVMQARDDLKIAANHVYVIPPGNVITVSNDRLKVGAIDSTTAGVAAIDVLFESVAAQDHHRMAGILLSGGGSDGSAGLQRIKKAGGLTLVQDPDEAPQETMPRAAIVSGCADEVLRVAEMPAQLLSSFDIAIPLRQPPTRHMPGAEPSPTLTPDESDLVREAVESLRHRTGRDFSCFREAMVLRHLRHRMERNEVENSGEYLGLLESNAAEPDALIRELLVSVTEFFRDQEAFDALAKYIPELFEGKGEADFVRVWVPACASGEEAYSIAMLLLEHARSLEHPPSIQVFACDLDHTAIEKARAGRYRASVVLPIGPERLTRFFQKEVGGYRVRRELRQVVLFAEHDVVWDPNFTRLDLISCRNLLIYLNPDGRKRMMDVFDLSLNPEGLLFLGPVEGFMGLSKAFSPVDNKHRIYRRSADQALATSGFATIQRSLAVEQIACGRDTRLKGGRAAANLIRLQDQLDLLQQRLLGSGLRAVPDEADMRQLQVITRELHATLEELEVSRQELRSMNAELTAVNLVLSERLGELEHANNEFNNLINAAAIPMVLLNRELKIMRYTPRTLDLFRLIPSDIGRPLSDLHAAMEYPELMDDASRVLNGGEPIGHEVRAHSGRWFFARQLPYYTQQNRIGGVVLTFLDMTEMRLPGGSP